MAQMALKRLPRRSIPDYNKVKKARDIIETNPGLTTYDYLDWLLIEANDWDGGYNIATLAMIFYPDETELIDDELFPTFRAQHKMKQIMTAYHKSEHSDTVTAYCRKNKDEHSLDHRYYNMKKKDEIEQVQRFVKDIEKALKRLIGDLSRKMNRDPKLVDAESRKILSQTKLKAKKMLKIIKDKEEGDGSDENNAGQ